MAEISSCLPREIKIELKDNVNWLTTFLLIYRMWISWFYLFVCITHSKYPYNSHIHEDEYGNKCLKWRNKRNFKKYVNYDFTALCIIANDYWWKRSGRHISQSVERILCIANSRMFVYQKQIIYPLWND